MAKIQLKTNRRTGAQSPLWSISKRFLYLMAAFMAAMTLAACSGEDENEGGENGENGGGSNVSGKRLKMYIVSSPGADDTRTEYTYNSDGSIKRNDVYNHKSSKLFMYEIYTNNPDGTLAKHEQYMVDMPTWKTVWVYSFDTNKNPVKRDGTSYMDNVIVGTSTEENTFQNGRKTRSVIKDYVGGALQQERILVFNYDSKGKRTTTNQTSNGKTVIFTRAYKADGTIDKVTTSDNSVTMTFTWENGKSIEDFDVHAEF